MSTPMKLAVPIALCLAACSQPSVTADAPPDEPAALLEALDAEDVQVRFEAVERLRQQLQTPVLSPEMEEGCVAIAAPPGLECAESVDFCKDESGRYYGDGGTAYEVAWAYPKDPPEVFEEGVFHYEGGMMGGGSGVIPGGIPLLEQFNPAGPRFSCGLRSSTRRMAGPTPNETEEEARERRAENQRQRQQQREEAEAYQACVEELERQRQKVVCEVFFVNPCRREAFMSCEEIRSDAGRLRQIDFPRDELLRVTWDEGTQEMSAIYTVKIETRDGGQPLAVDNDEE